jgi:16S rRNA (adenine1518-N6/adenine1519-N6)-dimethyltransferase
LTGGRLRTEADWRALIRRHGVHPDKRLGQHFLLDPFTLEKIVSAVGLVPGELVLEIGAGVGSLTCALAERAGTVIAIEFDRRLQAALTEAVGGLDNVGVVAGDVLALDLEGLTGGKPHAVVGNIPYNITSAVIRRMMEARQPARAVVLTIQEEVARRIVSAPGDMSLLSLSVRLFGEPKIVLRLSRGLFWPVPDVDSAVLRIDMAGVGVRTTEQIDRIFALARAGFGQRRKQLKNALSKGLDAPMETVIAWLEEAGIDPRRRAQSLSLEEWDRLAGVTRDRLFAD